jgi:hypothetical protein
MWSNAGWQSDAGGWYHNKASGGVWTPASLGSALVAWHKADVGVTDTGNNTAVTGWADQSGNGNDLAVHFTNQSTFHATGLGGKESIGFISGGSLLTATDAMTNMGTGNTASIFMLASISASTGSDGPAYSASGQSASSGANSAIFFFLSNTPDFTYAHASGTGTPQSVTADAETRIGMIFDGTNATPYKNNVAGSSSALNFNWASPGTFRIGGTFVGEIREVVITNTALSSTDRGNLDTYLVSRL